MAAFLVDRVGPAVPRLHADKALGVLLPEYRVGENGQKVDDKRVISSVSRCLNPYEEEGFKQMMEVAASDDLEIIVSNTTEAGIVYDPACKLEDVPASSFPGKLTQVLYHRYKAGKKGIIMLACELIDNNGKELLKCVNQYIEQWGLEDGFKKYVNEDCTFCGSLVDRIVPGRIRDPKEVAELEAKHGYADPLLDVGEVFGVWVIEGDTKLNDVLPFRKAGLEDHVFVTPDMSPYKKRKVRILNGAHTGFVLGAYLAGFDIVRDCMHDATILGYMNKMLLQEVVPILPLDQEDCKKFAAAGEVGVDVVGVHPGAGHSVRGGVANREAVLDDVLAVLDGGNGHLVALRNILHGGDGGIVDRNGRALGDGMQGNNNVILGVDLNGDGHKMPPYYTKSGPEGILRPRWGLLFYRQLL